MPHEELEQRRREGSVVAAKRRRCGARMQRRVGLDCGGARGPRRQSVRGGGGGAWACCVVSFYGESGVTGGAGGDMAHPIAVDSNPQPAGGDAAFQPVVNGVYGLVSSAGR